MACRRHRRRARLRHRPVRARDRRGDRRPSRCACCRPRSPLPIGRSAASTFCRPRSATPSCAEWNDTARAIPSATLPELFAAQAARTPEAVAVVFEDRSLTYARARCAREPAGASSARPWRRSRDRRRGYVLERSPEMLIALLGILKAGGAYLPLDPSYPPERLAYMLADAARAGAAVASGLLERLPEHDARSRVSRCRLARHRARAHHRSGQLPSIRTASPTSSTRRAPPERPKGAMVTHRGMLNHLAAKAHDLRPRSAGRRRADGVAVLRHLGLAVLVALWSAGACMSVSDDVAADPRLLLEQTAQPAA